MPEFKTDKKEWRIMDLLVETKLASSKNEARRLVTQNAVEVNGKKINEKCTITAESKTTAIRAGKRKFCKIVFK